MNARVSHRFGVRVWCCVALSALVSLAALATQAAEEKGRPYDGMLIQKKEKAEGKDRDVYLVFNGHKHLIPDKETFERLFSSWDGIEEDSRLVETLPHGPQLDGAILAKAHAGDVIYVLVLAKNIKFPIADMATFQASHFDSSKVALVSPEVLNATQTGHTIRRSEKAERKEK